MQIECGQCSKTITYQGSIPKFCSECGCSLSAVSSIQEDVTVARTPGSTSSSSGSTQDNTHAIGPKDVKKFNLETVGPYRLVRKLGAGGMGTVFEASHIESGQSVALKLLTPEVRGTDEMVQRFRRESQIAASINHPRSTFVYEAGEHDGQLYITMELMDGGTLKDVVAKEGPLPVGRAVDYVIDIIDGLLVAHNAGIVHRDLKPSNSFIDHDGRIKVGDFGLAKSFLGDSSLTQTGTFMGTPQYAAPEQIRNEDVDERTDIYALGGTLFYLLTGQAPFKGNPAQVISAIASQTPPKMSDIDKGIPKPLVKLVAQTLEKDPERRPFNLNVVRDQLLPFSTRGAMAADPGRRIGAYYVDALIGVCVGVSIAMISSPVLMFTFTAANLNVNPQIFSVFTMFFVMVAYFSICESRWGRTPGKWLFGLRVVDSKLESPSWLAALTRALLIPGLILVVDQAISLAHIWGIDPGDVNGIISASLKAQVSGRLVIWTMLLGLISIARKDNGYRAVHDWLSGTSVVRLSGNLESRSLDKCPISVPTISPDCEQIGQYQVVGEFGRFASGYSTHLGLDTHLSRPVWLFDHFAENPVQNERRHLTRPSRLRIIDQACDSDGYWYSAESVPGIPLKHVIKTSSCEWKSICPLFRDLAYELALSSESNLIPEGIAIDNFWLDHTGHIRILDHPLVSHQGIAKSPSQNETNHQLAMRAMVDLFELYMQHHDHPVEIMEISQHLQTHYQDEKIFDWLVTELNETIERQSSWNWIDRAGMLGISFGIEFSILSSAIFIVGFVFSGLPLIPQAIIAMLFGLVAAAASGYFFNGGPAMQLTGVLLRNNADKQPASKIRAMVRSVIAWLPWVWLVTLFLVLTYAIKNSGEDVIEKEPLKYLPFILSGFFVALLGFVSCFCAVINPARGLPDLIVRTRLMRK